jgi:hypothetical protein
MHIFYILLLSLFLAGCGGESEQIIAELEASGDLPVLDRTDSVAGIDSDNNGIRDDIDNYIRSTYTDPAQQAAAKQTAKATQNIILVDKFDTNKLAKADLEETRAIHCASDISGADGIMFVKLNQEIVSLTTNTKIRLLSYLEFSKAMDGSVSSFPEGDTCE